MSTRITLRDACPADDPFLFELYASTREAELKQVPWTASQKLAFLEMQFKAQKTGYAEAHPDAVHQMICIDAQAVGRLYLSREPDKVQILDITIAPSARNGGIGSEVLHGILDEADRDRKPVSIYVESFNPSLRLFQRLNFGVAAQDGFQLLLQRPASAAPSPESESPREADRSDG